MNPSEEKAFAVTESEFYKIVSELKEARNARVPYQHDQLAMANQAITICNHVIERVIERLKMIEVGER